MSIVRDNKWLWAVKIIAAIFQVPATWHVFTKIFEEAGRSRAEVYISTVLAILLIDAFFLAILYLLESPELNPTEKFPWACVGVGLLAANIVVGAIDEGWYAWMPRIGFIGLVLADLFAWATEFSIFFWSREQQEERLRNRQVLIRRRRNLKLWKRASRQLEPLMLARQKELEAKIQNLEASTMIIDQPEMPDVPQEVEEGIYRIGNNYGWYDPATDALVTETSLGKPYTSLTGVKRARTRLLRSTEDPW